MKISVKVLNGAEFFPEVDEDDRVIEIKKQILKEMNIPLEKQRLMLKGKPLQDDVLIRQCGLVEGSKIILSVKDVTDSPITSNTTSLSHKTTVSPGKSNLQHKLYLVLCRYYVNSDAKKISEEFIKELHNHIQRLSLDDIERVAKANLRK